MMFTKDDAMNAIVRDPPPHFRDVGEILNDLRRIADGRAP